MNQKCYLCDNLEAKITERPNGYDGKHVICPKCTQYRITRNIVAKVNNGYKIPAALSDKVRAHFEKTGKPFEINTITSSLL